MRNSEQFNTIETPEELGDQLEAVSGFSEIELTEIEQRRQTLSSLAYFIGKDFKIPVELNRPGAGWHWDFKENKIRIDPKDLLEKPMDYLRFVISHEGGHRRISRTEFIPLETWKQPGFSFMMNAIEDPRDNNFVAESYPKFAQQMQFAYEQDLDFEKKSQEKAKDKLGYTPRFMQAGFEYIKQWFKERQGEEFQISEDLPDEVREVVKNTLTSAQDSWWRYPSRSEADNPKEGEELIKKYAQVSYEINNKYIWPEFKKLVEKDMEDQKMQEFMKDMEQGKEEGQEQGQGLPQELKDKLTPEEKKKLEDAIEKSLEEAKQKQVEAKEGQHGDAEKSNKDKSEEGPKGKPIDLNSLSDELKQKIKDYLDSLPEDKKKELQEKAQKTLSDFEKDLNEELEGKLSDNPENAEERNNEREKSNNAGGEPLREGPPREDVIAIEEALKYKERLNREIRKDANIYEQVRREVLPLIDKLENELRAIFRARRARHWETGRKSGTSISIQHRIGEISQGIPAIDSHAWQTREKPVEKDYAISLLVDLSGSMWKDKKSQETFKAAIVLAEVLNRLSIKVEIIGFNDQVYEYQKFGEKMSNNIREHMGGMLQEVEDSRCKNCGNEHSETDLGWATEVASKRLEKQKADNRFLSSTPFLDTLSVSL